jgi:hypothetical protein
LNTDLPEDVVDKQLAEFDRKEHLPRLPSSADYEAARKVLDMVRAMDEGRTPQRELLNGATYPWGSLADYLIADKGPGSAREKLDQLVAKIPYGRRIRMALDKAQRAQDELDAEIVGGLRRVRSEPVAAARAPSSGCPSLPEAARLDPSLGSGAAPWLDAYVDHAMAKSPTTPRLFHESAALWLPSTLVARRLFVRMPFDDVYPNLFVVWFAPTTLYSKTTGLRVARSLARRVFPHLFAAQDSTPEALLSDMAGRSPSNAEKMTEEEKTRWHKARNFAAQRGLIRDEMSGLLASAGRDYMAGMIEAFLSFYDCTPSFTRSTRQQGLVEVQNAYLTMLGASTPAALGSHLQAERLWANGWWPRFALLCPDQRPEWRESEPTEEPPCLAAKLVELRDRLLEPTWPDQPKELAVRLGDGVYEAWGAYNKAMRHDLLTESLDHRLSGTYGRLPTQVLKIATILAALDWPEGDEAPSIELPHLARAIEIAEVWRASAHRVLEEADRSGFEGLRRRIVRLLGDSGCSLRELCKAMRRTKPDELKEILRQMVEAGDVEEFETKPGPKGGRPTTRYRLVTE